MDGLIAEYRGVCDCHEVHYTNESDPKEALKALRSEGWRVIGGQLACPDCAKNKKQREEIRKVRQQGHA